MDRFSLFFQFPFLSSADVWIGYVVAAHLVVPSLGAAACALGIAFMVVFVVIGLAGFVTFAGV